MEKSNYPQYTLPPPEAARIYPNMMRRIMFWCVGVFAIFLRLITFPIRCCYSKKTNTYLVYEPYGMGDVIALQPFVLALAKSGSKVIVAIKQEWQEVLPPHENITIVPINVSYSKYRNKKHGLVGTTLHTSRLLRKEARGAIGLDVRGDVRSICIMYMTGCRRVESFNRYFTANDCSVPCGSVSVRRAIDRTLLRYELNKLLLPSLAQEYFSSPTLTHLIDPATKCDMIGGAIALVPLAGWNGKEWIPEAWKGLIYSLKSRGQKLVLVHGPKEREQAVAAIGGNAMLGAVDIVEATTVGAWVNILISARAVAPAKHFSGSAVTDSGYSNSSRAIQPSKADAPRDVSDSVLVTSLRAVQSLNALSLTVTISLLNLTLTTVLLPSKQPSPTVITLKPPNLVGSFTSVSSPTYLMSSTAEPASTLMYS